MVTEYISQAWNAYRKNFWQAIGGLLIVALATVGIILLTGIPLFVKIISLFAASSNTPSLMQIISDGGVQSLFALFAAGIVVAIIAGAALEAGLVKMFADALVGKARIGTIFATARKKFWTIIGANILAGIIRLALFLVLVFPPLMMLIISSFGAASFQYLYASPSVFAPDIGVMLWFYGGLIAFLLLALPFMLVNQSVVVGGFGAAESVKKSISIIKGSYLQFLGLVVVIAAISLVVSFAPLIGFLLSVFFVAPIANLSYTAFYIEKAGARRKATGKRKVRKRKK